MKKSKVSFASAFALASTWFGLHCGGGFATGAQGVIYFTRFGAWELITTLIAAGLMGIYAYTVWDFARVAKTYTYRSTYNALFHPFDKIFANIHEVLYLLILVMAMGGVFSGAANVTVALFPQIPYMVGALLVAVIVLGLVFFGEGLLFRFSSILSLTLITAVITVTVAGILVNPAHILSVITQWEVGDVSFAKAAKMAVIYAGFQSTVMIGTVGMVRHLKTHKDTKMAGAFGVLINALLMILVSTMMLGFYPGVIGQELPIKTILDGIGLPALTFMYYLALYLACLTTGMTLVGSLVKRVENYGVSIMPSVKVRRRVFAVLVVVSCFLISLVGLLAIIGKGYGMIGYLSLPLVYVPTIILAPIKKRRLLQKDHEWQGATAEMVHE